MGYKRSDKAKSICTNDMHTAGQKASKRKERHMDKMACAVAGERTAVRLGLPMHQRQVRAHDKVRIRVWADIPAPRIDPLQINCLVGNTAKT